MILVLFFLKNQFWNIVNDYCYECKVIMTEHARGVENENEPTF